LGVIIVFIGLWVSSRANLGAPLLVRFFSKKSIAHTAFDLVFHVIGPPYT